MPRALFGGHWSLDTESCGRISWYQGEPADAHPAQPMLLLHSIAAAASAYDIKPLFDHYSATRPVYALELPGFGFSERSARRYTPRLMTDAIHEMVAQIQQQHGGPIDAIALSLSTEFLARAASENPQAFRSLALISPTGFESTTLHDGAAGETRVHPLLLGLLNQPLWRRAIFAWLTRRRSIRYFLRRAWGSDAIDAGLLDYDYRVTRPPGAEHAPLHFVGGALFSADSGRVYRALSQPVWAVHGERGDFHRYPGLLALSDRSNWTFHTLPSGALPHFELRQQFVRDYDRWRISIQSRELARDIATEESKMKNRNQGEGDKKSAERFNEAQTEFARKAGRNPGKPQPTQPGDEAAAARGKARAKHPEQDRKDAEHMRDDVAKERS